MPEHKSKSFSAKILFGNKKMSSVIFDAIDAPVGSTKRKMARSMLKSLQMAGRNYGMDGQGGPGDNLFGSTPGDAWSVPSYWNMSTTPFSSTATSTPSSSMPSMPVALPAPLSSPHGPASDFSPVPQDLSKLTIFLRGVDQYISQPGEKKPEEKKKEEEKLLAQNKQREELNRILGITKGSTLIPPEYQDVKLTYNPSAPVKGLWNSQALPEELKFKAKTTAQPPTTWGPEESMVKVGQLFQQASPMERVFKAPEFYSTAFGPTIPSEERKKVYVGAQEGFPKFEFTEDKLRATLDAFKSGDMRTIADALVYLKKDPNATLDTAQLWFSKLPEDERKKAEQFYNLLQISLTPPAIVTPQEQVPGQPPMAMTAAPAEQPATADLLKDVTGKIGLLHQALLSGDEVGVENSWNNLISTPGFSLNAVNDWFKSLTDEERVKLDGFYNGLFDTYQKSNPQAMGEKIVTTGSAGMTGGTVGAEGVTGVTTGISGAEVTGAGILGKTEGPVTSAQIMTYGSSWLTNQILTNPEVAKQFLTDAQIANMPKDSNVIKALQDIADAAKLTYHLDEQLNDLWKLKNQGVSFQKDAENYIKNKDTGLSTIDRMLSEYDTWMANADLSDPEAMQRAINGRNYYLLLQGKTRQRYADYVSQSIDDYNKRYELSMNAYSQASQQAQDYITRQTALTQAGYDEVKSIATDMYNSLINAQNSAVTAENNRLTQEKNLYDSTKTMMDIITNLNGGKFKTFVPSNADKEMGFSINPTTKKLEISNFDANSAIQTTIDSQGANPDAAAAYYANRIGSYAKEQAARGNLTTINNLYNSRNDNYQYGSDEWSRFKAPLDQAVTGTKIGLQEYLSSKVADVVKAIKDLVGEGGWWSKPKTEADRSAFIKENSKLSGDVADGLFESYLRGPNLLQVDPTTGKPILDSSGNPQHVFTPDQWRQAFGAYAQMSPSELISTVAGDIANIIDLKSYPGAK